MSKIFLKCCTGFALLLCGSLSAQIINIEEQRITGTTDSTHWYGHLRTGATLMKVQDQILQLNAAGQVEYKRKRAMALFLLDAVFLRAGNRQFNNAGFAHLRYNHKLTDPLSLEVFTQAQYNRLLLIELRTLAGSGLRLRLFKTRPAKTASTPGLPTSTNTIASPTRPATAPGTG